MKKSDISLAYADGKDIDYINQILLKTWLDVYSQDEYGIHPKDIIKYWREEINEKKDELYRALVRREKGWTVVLGLIKGVPVGVCSVLRFEDLNLIKSHYVLPEYQGQTIGTKLLEAVFKFHVSKATSTHIAVAKFNRNAIEYYQSHGFVLYSEEEMLWDAGHFTLPLYTMILPAGLVR